MGERRRFNPKRRITDPRPDSSYLGELAARVRYVGSPYHKRNPGDFGLSPASQPRPDKTLCDGASIFTKSDAQRWLETGVKKGLISANEQNAYPAYVWAVTDNGIVLEARLSGGQAGEYHGYPLFEADPFRQIVLRHWIEQ